MTTYIDINCDMGEAFSIYRCGDDEGLMPLITVANVACGFHGGEPHVMSKTVDLAMQHGVAIGAHPGLRKHPGRLIAWVKARANDNVHNLTQVLSATDTSGGDLTGGSCPTGYCHLGGPRVSDRDAYGAGLVSAARP